MDILIAQGDSAVVLEKDKDARKHYLFQLSGVLSPGDGLQSVTWVATTGLVVDGTGIDGTSATAFFSGGTPNSWFLATATWTSTLGATDQFVVRVFIKEDAELLSDLGSALFPNRYAAVAQLRRDRLAMAAQNYFAGVTLDDDYLWEKLRAAEASISRTLRVKFQATAFFPLQPTQEQIDALNGMPWEIDTGYDYDPLMYRGDRWGFMQTHHLPIVSVESVRFAYPSTSGTVFDIPREWLQLNPKYGHVQIVPVSPTAAAMLNPSMLSIISSGKVIPNMVQITYVAGLTDVAKKYPDLIDIVKKMAVLKLIEDGFLPQSGSISADGLSQTISTDMSKYEDMIDYALNGPAGSNGGLKAAIHGIRLAVL